MDPERVHEQALSLIAKGWFRAKQHHDSRLAQTLFGVQFPNPLWLAAGFDKNGIALEHWHKLGFGFVECGTVTRYGQPGNPKPRMFRLPCEGGLINRLGFNNRGAEALAARLEHSKPKIPLGINLGKTKATPLEQASGDYQESFRLLHAFGSYFVVNVSSPNTPGLRKLQDKGPLLEIVNAIHEVDAARPLFIKVAPDLEAQALDDVIEVAVQGKLTGLIATNTTVRRDMLVADPGESGGLSGSPLRTRSDEVLRYLYLGSPRELILVGVGGVMNGLDVHRKIALGAHLCQVYTGWVYGGPGMIPTALAELCAEMDRTGIAALSDLRGSKARF